MKKFIAFFIFINTLVVLAGGVVSSSSNELDKNCPSFFYKSAPRVPADQFICHSGYGVAYSYATKTPIYSAEYLEASHIGNSPRTNDFRPDPAIPAEHSATLADYKGTIDQCGGAKCDRGHQIPDQDASATQEGVSETFYLSNIVPQNYQNNQIIWKYLETKVRSYVQKRNPAYVISGPVYLKRPYNTIGKGVAVPDMLFKVVIDSVTGESIAFLMDNANFPVGSLNGKVVPLQEIEKVTGITFDASLDKGKSASYQDWFSGLK